MLIDYWYIFIREFSLVAVLVMATLTACTNITNSVTGSGTLIDETREVADFSRIELRTMGQVTVTLGEAAGVQLRVEDNLMPLVETNVRDGWLVIESPPNTTLSPTRTLEINVSMPELVEIKLSGAGLIQADGVAVESMTTTIPGSGNVIVSGTVDRQTVDVTGAGNYDASALASRDAVVTLSGTGNVVVDVSGTLNATLTGTGNILYSGDPAVTQSGSGTGSIRPR
jgi:hypothetical protein